ncbi:MAG: hypothetical protein ACRCXL_06685 [Dermatophilaceae bacterium]
MRSRTDRPLVHLDNQMSAHAAELSKIGIDEPAVASRIHLELDDLDERARHRIRAEMKIAPERFRDELIACQAFHDDLDGRDAVPPSTVRAQMIVLLYTSFVMLRDSLLAPVRKEVAPNSVAGRVVDFLSKDELRLFRNSIAHGHWDYAGDFSGLVYWAQPSRGLPHCQFRIDQATFNFWQRLSRATSYATVLALTGPGQPAHR